MREIKFEKRRRKVIEGEVKVWKLLLSSNNRRRRFDLEVFCYFGRFFKFVGFKLKNY